MVAGEASGDLLAGSLLASLRARWPKLIAEGIGGPHMAAHGFVAWWPHDKLSVRGFNAEGMRRRGFSAERIAAVKQMHRLLYRDGLTFDDARARIGALAEATPEAADDVRLVGDFLASAKRGIAR